MSSKVIFDRTFCSKTVSGNRKQVETMNNYSHCLQPEWIHLGCYSNRLVKSYKCSLTNFFLSHFHERVIKSTYFFDILYAAFDIAAGVIYILGRCISNTPSSTFRLVPCQKQSLKYLRLKFFLSKNFDF